MLLFAAICSDPTSFHIIFLPGLQLQIHKAGKQKGTITQWLSIKKKENWNCNHIGKFCPEFHLGICRVKDALSALCVKQHEYEAYFKLKAIEYAAENGN